MCGGLNSNFGCFITQLKQLLLREQLSEVLLAFYISAFRFVYKHQHEKYRNEAEWTFFFFFCRCTNLKYNITKTDGASF